MPGHLNRATDVPPGTHHANKGIVVVGSLCRDEIRRFIDEQVHPHFRRDDRVTERVEFGLAVWRVGRVFFSSPDALDRVAQISRMGNAIKI